MPTTMKDSLSNLFRERFQGHEAPVDPGTWAVIEAKLLTALPDADRVNELFRERFQSHEVPVDPAAWEGISAQLGHGATAGGLLSGYGWLAAGLAGILIVGAVALSLNGPEEMAPQTKAIAAEPDPATAAPAAAEAQASTEVPQAAVAVELRVTAAKPPQAHRARTATEATAEASTEPTGDAAPNLVEAPAESPAIVEQIIQSITAQVRQEVSTNSAVETKPRVPAEGEREDDPGARPIEAPAAPKLFMPNTFTPNNDGINDSYVVPMDGFTSVMMRVYSIKTNQLVFATNSGEPWNGANCEDGMYLVAVEAITSDGRTVAEGKVVYLNRNSTN